MNDDARRAERNGITHWFGDLPAEVNDAIGEYHYAMTAIGATVPHDTPEGNAELERLMEALGTAEQDLTKAILAFAGKLEQA